MESIIFPIPYTSFELTIYNIQERADGREDFSTIGITTNSILGQEIQDHFLEYEIFVHVCNG